MPSPAAGVPPGARVGPPPDVLDERAAHDDGDGTGSELLGLVWGDVDFEAGFVRVRKQLGRDGVRVERKTRRPFVT